MLFDNFINFINLILPPEIIAKFNIDLSQIQIEHVSSTLHLNPAIRKKCSETWKKVKKDGVENNKHLYDGTNARFEGIEFLEGNIPKLKLSVIKYHLSNPLISLAYNDPDFPQQFLSRMTAVVGIVRTSDNLIVIGNKSGSSFSLLKRDLVGGILDYAKEKTDLSKFLLKEIGEEIGVRKNSVISMMARGIVTGISGS